MADDITLNAGSGGDTIAADDILGVKYPRSKIVFGADGSAADVSAANPLPVVLKESVGTDIGDVVVANGIGASAVPIQDGGNSITVDDGASSLTVDHTALDNAASADYDTGAGTDTTTMFGLALPANGGAVAGGTATAPLRVDPTGTTTQPVSDAGGSLTVDNATLSVVGGGTEASALRVTIASDSTGVLSVDDNGSTLSVDDGAGSLTVDNAGTFAVQENGAALTALQLIDDPVGTDGAAAPAKAFAVGGTDGTNLQTLKTDVNGELQVDVLTLPNVTIGAALPAGTNNIGDVDIASALPAGDNNIGNVDIASALPAGDNNIGNVDIASALPAGTNNIGDVDVASIAAGTNNIGNVGLIGRASGGMSIFRSIDLDESEEEVKASGGQVFSISAFNTTAAPLFLKFYNATAANVTVGTTTPVLTFVVPANADSDGAGFVWNNDIGFAFSTAITVACTTGVADSDTGAPGANACIVNIGYV